MYIIEKKFTTLEDAASALAIDIAENINEGISARGHSLLAVSGGNTPKKVFNYLRKQKVDWNKVTITLTDERWVPNDHPESNEQLVMSHLLNYLSNDISFVPLYGGQATLKDDIKSCESRLEKLSLPFDAVYLGMGPDGHFASLFPGDETLDNSNSLCVAVEGTNSRLARISLTASAILNARKIYLLFSGEDKLSIYRKARIPGSHYEIPIRFVLSQNEVPVMVYYT
jgi:6-phosphogluconolactonase